MQYLLAKNTRAVLSRLAGAKTLYAFDFDGTLAPIVEHPDVARMRDQTRRLLGLLAARYPCVVISGRARADVLERLEGVELARVIGNHGAETEKTTVKSRRRIQQWLAALGLQLPPLPGLWIEDKGLSLTVHYRLCTQKAEARRQILRATGTLRHARVVGGRQVVNLVDDKAPHKGDVLASERDRLGCDRVLYVGDDETDEDAFGLKGYIVAVRIGRKQRSRARYFLRTQTEIEMLLELLCKIRPTSGAAPFPSGRV